MKRHNWIVGVAAIMTVGCSSPEARDAWQRLPGPDDAVSLVPWFATMHTDIAIRPYKYPRPPVDGTVPVTGADVRITPLDLLPTNSAALGIRFPNPIPRTAESIDRGRDRYNIYCAVCHGTTGNGDGPVAQAGFPTLALTTPLARGYTDGYLYAMIAAPPGNVAFPTSRGLMPSYRDKVRGDDRWHIVNYVRVLQGTSQ